MSSIIQLSPAGSLKQGQVVFAVQFEGTSVWQFALCKINGQLVLFAKHSTGTTFSPISPSAWNDSGWLTDAGCKDYLSPLSKYVLPATTTVGMTYTTDNALEIGLYSDGAGHVSTTPTTAQTTADVIKGLLSGSTVTGDTTTTTPAPATDKKWYQKPITWVIAAVAVVGGYLFLKK